MTVGLIGGLAACGDDDESGAPTKAEFVEQANAIFCDELGGAREEIGQRVFTSETEPPTAEQLAAFSLEFEPIYREHIEAFRVSPRQTVTLSSSRPSPWPPR